MTERLRVRVSQERYTNLKEKSNKNLERVLAGKLLKLNNSVNSKLKE